MLKLTLEEMLLLKNLIVEIKEEFAHPHASTREICLSLNLNDQMRLNEITQKLSDVVRTTLRVHPIVKELRHG